MRPGVGLRPFRLSSLAKSTAELPQLPRSRRKPSALSGLDPLLPSLAFPRDPVGIHKELSLIGHRERVSFWHAINIRPQLIADKRRIDRECGEGLAGTRRNVLDGTAGRGMKHSDPLRAGSHGQSTAWKGFRSWALAVSRRGVTLRILTGVIEPRSERALDGATISFIDLSSPRSGWWILPRCRRFRSTSSVFQRLNVGPGPGPGQRPIGLGVREPRRVCSVGVARPRLEARVARPRTPSPRWQAARLNPEGRGILIDGL